MGEIALETNVFVQIDRLKFHAFKQMIVNRGDSAIAENFENREIYPFQRTISRFVSAQTLSRSNRIYFPVMFRLSLVEKTW